MCESCFDFLEIALLSNSCNCLTEAAKPTTVSHQSSGTSQVWFNPSHVL